MMENADSAAEMTTMREKLSQKPDVLTVPAAPAADAVGRREVRKRVTRGVGREERLSISGMVTIR